MAATRSCYSMLCRWCPPPPSTSTPSTLPPSTHHLPPLTSPSTLHPRSLPTLPLIKSKLSAATDNGQYVGTAPAQQAHSMHSSSCHPTHTPSLSLLQEVVRRGALAQGKQPCHRWVRVPALALELQEAAQQHDVERSLSSSLPWHGLGQPARGGNHTQHTTPTPTTNTQHQHHTHTHTTHSPLSLSHLTPSQAERLAANLDEDIRAGGSVDGGEEEETAPSQQSAAAAAPGSSLLALDRSIRGVVEEEEGEGEEMEDEEVERLKGAVPGAPSGGGAGTKALAVTDTASCAAGGPRLGRQQRCPTSTAGQAQPRQPRQPSLTTPSPPFPFLPRGRLRSCLHLGGGARSRPPRRQRAARYAALPKPEPKQPHLPTTLTLSHDPPSLPITLADAAPLQRPAAATFA